MPKDSATVAINSLAQQKLTQESKFIISVLENPNYPHPSIINAVTQAMEQGHTLYPPIMGIPELRHMGCEWMYRSYDCSFQNEQCLVVNGGKLGIYLLMQLLLQPNDEVIIPSPYWVSYPAMVSLFGGTPCQLKRQKPKNGN